jgi:soluble lytic murein transglycosylase-like protein
MGGKKATSTSQVTIPPEVLARYNAANKAAETAAASPYQAFGANASDYVAQINPQQTMGITGVNTSANSYQPYLESATGTVKGAMGGLNPEDIQRYMSPYVGMVAGSTAELMKQANEQAQSGALGAAASSGAFGGDRAGIAAANLNQQNQLAMGKTMSDIYNQGYGQALSTAQQQQGVQLQGAQMLSGLGAQAQGLGLQGAQAQLAAGTMQQQTEQAGKDAMIKSFMQEKGYPFQTAQFLANIAMGTGALSGSTTTSTQPTGVGGFFRDGGKVDGYAGGGGVSGPMSDAARGFDEEGYVPAGLLPVGQLMVANPPDQQRSGGLGNIIKLASTVSGFASGGVADGRHGYENGGAPPKPGLAPAPQYKEYAVNGDVFHRTPQGAIADAYGNPVDIDRAESVRKSIEGQEMLTGGQRLIQSDEMVNQFRQSQEAAAQRNRDALVGMYGGDFPISERAAGLAAATRSMPEGGPGTFPAAAMPAGLVGPLQHPVNPNAAFKANLGAAYNNMRSAEAAQERAGLAGMPPPARPAGLGAAPVTQEAATATPAPGVAAPAESLFDTKIVPIESGGRQLDENGQPITSSAGAVGAAQVMEGTGPEAAQLAGLPWDRDRWMYDKDYNLALGRAYFNEQLRQFGDADKAAAAYNAGPGAVRSAIDRATALGGSYLDYLPAETQNYVSKFSGGTGLGAASLPQPGGDKSYEDRNAIGQFMYNPEGGLNRNAVLSILSGIGQMAQARTVSPLGALLSGVGAGADTYANLQKQAADIAQTQAQTQETSVRTSVGRFFMAPNGMPMVIMPDGTPVDYWTFQSSPELKARLGSAQVASIEAAAKAAGATAPAQENTVYSTPAVQSAVNGEMSALSARGGDRAASAAILDDINRDAATAGGGQIANRNTQLVAFSNLNAANPASGPGFQAPWRFAAANALNFAFKLAGSNEQVANTVDDAQLIGKAQALLSSELANNLDQTTLGGLQAIANAMPNASQDPQASAELLATLVEAQQRQIDLKSFADDYINQPGNSARTAFNVQSGFNEAYGREYEQEKAYLKKLILEGGKQTDSATGMTLMQLLTSGQLSEAEANDVLKQVFPSGYPAHITRYFAGH